jgi:hypothetical protein
MWQRLSTVAEVLRSRGHLSLSMTSWITGQKVGGMIGRRNLQRERVVRGIEETMEDYLHAQGL